MSDEDDTPRDTPHARRRGRIPCVIIVAASVELHCPRCEATQPAPGGSEFCEPIEARAMCDGRVTNCVACDEPIRMTWQDRVRVA